MYNRIKQFIEKENLIESNDTIIAGISGGADSICLLCVLKRLSEEKDFKIIVVHVNHGIRVTALRDLEFTSNVCKDMGVEFVAVNLDVKKYAIDNHLSTEEAGRILRYKSFEDLAKSRGIKDYKIAVAHNMDDNAETMLLNMVRGSGIKGLTGIMPKRDNIIRPLIKSSRAEIEEFLSAEGMEYVTDETNLSDDYTRNKIRHYIMPVCDAINEKFLLRFSELSTQIAEAEDYLMVKSNEAYEMVTSLGEDGCIHIIKDKFDMLHTYLQKRIILDAIANAAGVRKDIGAVHVNLLLGLMELQVGRIVSLPYDLVAIREYEGIRIGKGISLEMPDTKGLEEELLVPGKTVLGSEYLFEARIYNLNPDLPHIIPDSTYLKWFDYDKLLEKAANDKIKLRFRNVGDVICINKDGGTKKLKNFFVDAKIPLEQRANTPLVAIGNEVIWVTGSRTSSSFRVDKNTKTVLEVKCIARKVQSY